MAAAVLLCCFSCGVHRDYPPELDTPEPDPLNGIFKGDAGIMTFNGDGKTVVVEFVGEAASKCPNGTLEYAFTWGSRGLVRYDVADRLTLSLNDEHYYFLVQEASPTSLTIDWMVFKKQQGR